MADILAEDAGTIRCICGYDHDDNFTIQCERCNAWQHAMCVNISDENSVPEHYLCPECSGKMGEINVAQAREKQRLFKKRKIEYEKFLEAAASPDNEKVANPRTRSSRRSTGSAEHEGRNSSRSGSLGSAGVDGSGADGTGSSHGSAGVRSDGEGSRELPPPVKFNSNFYNIPVETNKWTPTALALWTELNNTPHSVHELPLRLSAREYSENSRNLRVVRNAAAQNKWVIGIEAGGLACASNFSSNVLVGEVLGEIMTREEYASNALNQFAQLGCPQMGVVFVPGQPFVVDSRKYGSNAVFIKRSATPNAYLATRKDKKGNLRVFIATRKSVKAGTELTLGWHWPEMHPVVQHIEALAGVTASVSGAADGAGAAEPTQEVRDILWLLHSNALDVKKSRKTPLGADEEWGILLFPYLPQHPSLAERRRDDIARLDVGVEEAEDPQTAPEDSVWQSASECGAPPPKKRMSLADYRRKRT